MRKSEMLAVKQLRSLYGVEAQLEVGLSPEQIALTLGSVQEPVRESHETIDTALYALLCAMPGGHLRDCVLTLRQSRSDDTALT